MTFLRMENLDLKDKRVLIRADLNVPIQNGQILNDARLKAIIPTLELALKKQARVLLVSHLGRPKEGLWDEAFSLRPIADALSKHLGYPIRFEKDWINGVSINPQEIVLGENVRFLVGEEACDETLSKRLAACCDIFIMDAFATAHRAQASTVGITRFVKTAAAGPLVCAELDAIHKALKNPERPFVAIVGGSKISTKLGVLKSLIGLVDVLILGGGLANTLLLAKGYSIGKSLCEPNLVPLAKELIALAEEKKVNLLIPQDFVISDEKIMDVGPKTIHEIDKVLESAKTILWNGPLGVFEIEAFGKGTQSVMEAITHSSAFSMAGGGETIAAIERFGSVEKISYISTGGGAFLEMVEGKTLPAIAALEEKESSSC